MSSSSESISNDLQVAILNPSPSDSQTTVLSLNWSTRDSIITWLNRFSGLLNGIKLKNDEIRQQLIKELGDLILVLSRLPSKVNERQSNRSPNETSNENSMNYSDLLLDLTSDLRIRIVDQLIKNQNSTILYKLGISTTVDNRTQLVTENNLIIQKLLNLPVWKTSDDATSNNPNKKEDVEMDEDDIDGNY